ncbi:MAG: GNAT family N-acetyltransferase [Duncaniella sp.]|nr:GNAT family N-acetyltransferase [Duncaniella sp.]HBI58602.1 GNAT family N-acetyltransferase [Porphyromonadaceae bacterium]
MRKIIKCNETDYRQLAEIWERSVRATHDFLDEAAINEIKEMLIPAYFPAVDLYAIDDNGEIAGFIGLSGDKIEMLFIDSVCLRKGCGSLLVDFAIQLGAAKVDVNEHNPEALKFYRAKGFRTIGRDETDEAGRPYPILHLPL